MDASNTVDLYVEAWTERDASRRASLLNDSFSSTGTYTDPRFQVAGAAALVDHIGGFHERFPDATMERRSSVDAYGKVARFAWAIVTDGKTDLEGTDFIAFDEDGRIRSVTGFFGVLD